MAVGITVGLTVGMTVGSQMVNEHEQNRCEGGAKYCVSHVPDSAAKDVGKLQ